MEISRYIPPTTERASAYDGVFSYVGEVHSAIVGLVVGVLVGITGHPSPAMVLVGAALDEQATTGTKALSEFRTEPWYGLAGLGVGIALGVLVRPVI